jgi:hypothetical protein
MVYRLWILLNHWQVNMCDFRETKRGIKAERGIKLTHASGTGESKNTVQIVAVIKLWIDGHTRVSCDSVA